MIRVINVCNVLTVGLLLSSLISAGANAEGYLQNPQFIQFLNKMEKEHNYDRFQLVELFSDVRQQKSILKAISRPAEKSKTWAQYKPIFITPKNIQRGVDFYNKHKETLLAAEKEYGVPAEVIVAIIGVETRYGSNKGSYRVIDALSTLAFDYPPRSKFFTSELEHFIQLSKEAGLDPKVVKGSYAGAMGFPQFISSSYRSYAIDFDKDGKTDLINNPKDAIGSVANYFKRHGWKTGEKVITLADLAENKQTKKPIESLVNKGLKPKFTVGDITSAGLAPRMKLNNNKAAATAWKVEGETGDEYWIGLHNFYVITRYNHSHMYAMAVHQLSQAVGRKI